MESWTMGSPIDALFGSVRQPVRRRRVRKVSAQPLRNRSDRSGSGVDPMHVAVTCLSVANQILACSPALRRMEPRRCW